MRARPLVSTDRRPSMNLPDEDSDEDENDGPMFLMPSKKMADAMIPDQPANSFGEYLLPYAILVGGALLLASAAFALLVLKG